MDGLQTVGEHYKTGEYGNNHLWITSADVFWKGVDTSSSLSTRRQSIDSVGEVIRGQHGSTDTLWHDALQDRDNWSSIGQAEVTETVNLRLCD